MAINGPVGNLNIVEAVAAVNIDPSTGLVIGTAAQPLITQTSSLQTTSDLTTLKTKTTTATTQVIQAAVAAKRTRLYRLRLEVSGATVITIQDNATVLEEFNFPGAARVIYDFATRPWHTGSLNTVFQYLSSGAVTVNAIWEYTNAA